ncbi:MAG: TRAP transporter substrate-binding protein [Gemmatimonadetes bacterium]|nr:TRAP transporter substrate-binding protein [Gemmatimonadota bacterium]
MPSDASTPGTPVDRRAFLGTAAGTAAGTLAACAGPGDGGVPGVVTQPNVVWRLASSFPRSLDALFGSAERLAMHLAEMTENRFQIRPYPAGELVPALQVMDAAQQGTVQVGHTPGYYYTGKNAVLAFDTGVPFGLDSRQQDAWLYSGGGLDLMNEVYADFGILVMPAGNTGAQMGGWFKREVRTVSDLRGLKMRIPGLGGDVMDRLGVTVQVLAGGDIYPALERGAIDATEWVGPYDDEKLGFHRAARFYYYPGWWEPGPSMSFMVNRAAWDRLPSSYQQVFRAAAARAAIGTSTIYDSQNPAALDRLLAGGVQLRRFTPEIMEAARTAANAILEENATRDATYRRVYEAWRSFRDSSFRWFGTAERAYADFAFPAMQG